MCEKTKTLKELCQEAHVNAIEKGWYDRPRQFGELIALTHGELSEALEEYREGNSFEEIYYKGEKPCGIPIEMADTVIYILSICEHLCIDLEAAIEIKMAYNKTRPHRHGGKKI